MGLMSRLKSLVVRAIEGEVRPGPWQLPISGGWLPADIGQYWNWWQRGYDIQTLSPSAVVEACVKAYAETTAMCPGDHWRQTDNGGRERVETSALSRILREPNGYDSISDFMLNTVRSLYTEGNAYAVALRNSRSEVDSLHLMDASVCSAHVADTGDIFYSLAGNPVIEQMVDYPIIVPQRDVLHIRLSTDNRRRVLRGESPLVSVAREMMKSDAVDAQQIQFYLNQARPSTVLTTELQLSKEQVDLLRQMWDQQSKGLNVGGTPILTSGLKPQPLSTNMVDAQLAEILKLSDQRIALAYRIPLQILGIGGAAFGSTELLMQSWISSGLGFCLNHVEEALGKFFGLTGQPWEYVEFDTDALLRSAFKDRIEGFARSVQSGIHAPNEARAQFNLPKSKDGDEPRVQAQVVPLSAADAIPSSPTAPSAETPALSPPEPKGMTDAERDDIRLRFRSSHARALSV